MLCVVGDLVEDVIVRPLVAFARRDTDNPSVVDRRRGGSAANVAAAAAALGAEVRFVGRVGDDALGDVLVAELAAAGVDVVVQRAGRTGTIVIVVEPGGVRTMYPDRGAAAEMGPIGAAAATDVTWFHLPAYTWCTEPPGHHADALLAAARAKAAVRVSVDLSSVALLEDVGAAGVTERLRCVRPDVVLATMAEWAVVDPMDIGGAVVVIKDGPRPVEIRHADGHREQVLVEAVGEVVDPTGAGDVFAAGYVVAAMSGCAPVDAARAGIAAAARTLGRVGASLG